ncbi:hypothetical protein [Pararhizobium mangrovi]|uniref:Uncharacterized protein n=1 Tax=Pararhizobium mangrovi TaxID=2590452 RepID=A0A506U1L8_9HYPH|nr:hypothetical protein [Pararhizobium mangrovi]TPW25737.1 hypothetical protein FJU11_18135 [Pararhizobium mangrovi]
MGDRSTDRGGRRSHAALPSGFETRKDAEKRCCILIKRLERRTDDPRSMELASCLRACTAHSRCMLEACPKCLRRFRGNLYREARRIVPKGAEIVTVSMIPEAARVELDALQTVDIPTRVKRYRKSLSRALPPEAMFVGGIDISMNAWHNRDDHWNLHLYGYVILPKGSGVGKRSSCGASTGCPDRDRGG